VITNQALRIDPESTDLLVLRQAHFMVQHRWAEAEEASRAVLTRDPMNGPGVWNLSETYAFSGNLDSAVTAVERLLRDNAGAFGSRGVATLTYAAAGKWKEAREQRRLAEIEATNSPNFIRTYTHIAFGDREAAMSFLERAVANREPLINTTWIGCEPYLDILHDHPRFEAILTRLGAVACPVSPRWPIGPPKP
jgi:predicted Zn-dependent protease